MKLEFIIFSERIVNRLRGKGVDLDTVAKREGFSEQMAELDSTIRDIMQHEGYSDEFFVAPGVPRIRPVLIYLSSEIGAMASQESAEKGRLMHLALSAEIFYSAVLVHDLALGESGSKRRSLLKKFVGRALRLHERSWHGGNQLITRSFELVMMTHSSEIMSEFVRSMREVQDAQKTIVEQEVFPSSCEVMSFIETYTGEMFGFACRAGGMMSKAPRAHCNLLARYGRELGVAWQLTEELAHMEGRNILALEEQVAMGRPFYAVALAAEQDPNIQSLWAAVLREDVPVEQLMDELIDSPSLVQTRQTIVEHVWSARSILRDLPHSSHRDQLDHLAFALAN